MKIIFKNYLIETDEIQAITPLIVYPKFREIREGIFSKRIDEGFHQSFKIFLLNKTIPLFIEFSSETATEEAQNAYQKLVDIWKDKQDKFLTII